MNHLLPLLARLLMVPIFVNAAFSKINDPINTAKYMREAGIGFATELFLYGAITFLLLGSLSLLLGLKTRVGIFLLLFFLVPTTLLYHWDFSGPEAMGALFSNAAIIGGLIALLAYGPGGISIDAKLNKVR